MRPIETWNPAVSSLADGAARATRNAANKTLEQYVDVLIVVCCFRRSLSTFLKTFLKAFHSTMKTKTPEIEAFHSNFQPAGTGLQKKVISDHFGKS
jgi:hypothetical protein